MSISFELVCDECNSDEVYFQWIGNNAGGKAWFSCFDCGERDYEQGWKVKGTIKRWFKRER